MCAQLRSIAERRGEEMRMNGYMRSECLREMDEALLPFRLVGKREGAGKHGWLRGIRLAVGMPVEEAARRLGVTRWEIYRLEKSEENQRIQLATLQRAAEGLGCELVYALRPKEGRLEEMAAEQARLRESGLAKRRAKREAGKDAYVDFLGWRKNCLAGLQTMLRNEGYRVRPRTTDRGDEEKMRVMERQLRALKLTGMLGPFMEKFLTEQAAKRGA